MKREFLENLGLTGEAVDAILSEAAGEVGAARFDGVLSREILGAHGRSEKAIAALLDLDALRAADDPAAEVKAALTALQKSDGYLFETPAAPFAAGAGRAPVGQRSDPALEAIRSAAGLDAEE